MNEEDNTVREDVQAAPEGQPASEDVTTETLADDASSESDNQQAADNGAPDTDDQLKKFAESQGIELDSPNAIKAAQALQKARSEATKNHQKATELEKATKITDEQIPEGFTPQQHDNVRVRNLELKFAVQDWKSNNPDKAALESEMVKVLADPTKLLLVQEGHLSLDDVYHIARGGNTNLESDLKLQGKQEGLQNLAQKQKAAVPRGNAVNTSTRAETITKENVNQLVAQNGQAWFEKNYEAINRAMAS